MTDYAALLRELAIPRLVGTPNHERVRAVLKRELAARGFDIEEHLFHGRPARLLLGTPPLIQGINLIARRGSAPPPVWLVAHYDSKGQPIAMAVRLLGVSAVAASLVLIFFALLPALICVILGIAILSFNRVTDNSPGALDNATALVAVFMAADLYEGGVGVVFPDAEEFGLLGARALARERADLFAGRAVINLDGLDDIGAPIAFQHRPGKVVDAVARALGAIRSRWLPVVVDGMVLAGVAGECTTIMKGNWRTMTVVHTPKDRADRLTLTGARTVAQGLARALSEP